MEARAPPALLKGDTIALVSPSARKHDVWPWRLQRATRFLEQQGYCVKDCHAYVPESPLSANAAARAEELHSAFRDPSVKAIICCIGGSNVIEMIPALDPEIIRNNPKIVTGGSDNTLLHHFFYVNGLRTFYGPSAITQLGEWPEPLGFTWDHFVKVVTCTEPIGQMPRSAVYTDESTDRKLEPQKIAEGTMQARTMKATRGWRWLKPGKAEGHIWGGCLPSVLQPTATKYEVSYQGKIGFIGLQSRERLPLAGYTNDLPEIPKNYLIEVAICNIHNLGLRGILDQIVGLIVGRPNSFSLAEEQEWEDAIRRALEGYDFPVLANVDAGHTDPILTIPLGARVRLDHEKDLWEVLEPGVVPSN